MINFFMVPNEVFDLNLKPQQFAVLCYILKCCDESNTCYPSIHTIAEACAISDNTVRESIKFLCKRKIHYKIRAVLRSANTARFSHRPICSRSTRIFMTKVSAGTTLSNITKTKTLPPHNLQQHTLRISLHTPCKNTAPPYFKYYNPWVQNLQLPPSEFEPVPFKNLKPNNTHRKD